MSGSIDRIPRLCSVFLALSLILFLLAVPSHAQKVENKVWICGVPKIPKYSAEEWKQKYEQDLLTKPKLVVIKQQNQRIFWLIMILQRILIK